MTQATDLTWWQPFLAGNLDGFARLIDRHQADVFAVALATVLDRGLAEDVAQETFIAAFQRRTQLRDPAAIGGWLAAIARNLGRDLLRKRKREQLVEPRELDVESEVEDVAGALDRAALCRDVQRAVGRVPVRYREVLVLYYSHERSVSSIARSLGLTEAATMQRLSRGRRLMRERAGDLHASRLQTFATTARPSRSFTIAVLALLGLRQHARAATDPQRNEPRAPSARPPRLHGHGSIARRAGWIAGLVAVLCAIQSDQASGQASAPPAITDITSTTTSMVTATPSTPITTTPPTTTPMATPRTATPMATAPTNPSTRIARAHPATAFAIARPHIPPRVAPPTRTAALDETTTCTTSALPSPPSIAIETVESSPPCAAGCVPPSSATVSRAPLPYDQINGLLETAALPRARDISYETVGTAMLVRVGITRNLALHVGMIPMDTDQGTTGANANPAFGGGIKLGTRMAKHGAIALVAEGAREVNLKTADTREGYLGRAYAAVTLGSERNNLTLISGVVSEFDGTNRWRSPVIGLSSNVAWDDHLGFVLESQRFTTPRGSLKGMSVFAVRFRNHAVEDNFLGVDRLRIDVGVLLLDRTDDDVDGLPWLQAGLGW